MKKCKQRVHGYTRVSTVEQSPEGISLEAQKAKIQAYCDLNELERRQIKTKANNEIWQPQVVFRILKRNSNF